MVLALEFVGIIGKATAGWGLRGSGIVLIARPQLGPCVCQVVFFHKKLCIAPDKFRFPSARTQTPGVIVVIIAIKLIIVRSCLQGF